MELTWDGPVTSEMDVEGIDIPATEHVLNAHDYQELREYVDPLSSSENHGIDLYQRTVHFCSQNFNNF